MAKEYALTVTSNECQLMSIVHCGNKIQDTALVIVVGGPQYRIGSHRQFVQLAREVSEIGYFVIRLDTQGMGDSEGDKLPFEFQECNISSTLDSIQNNHAHIKHFVLWGLCDAASASLMYAHKDNRISGLVLLNPWLEDEQVKAKTMLGYYYVNKLISKSFWEKFLTGKLQLATVVKDLGKVGKQSIARKIHDYDSYQSRMLHGLSQFSGKVCVILSERDITAQSFERLIKQKKEWITLSKKITTLEKIVEADHTFSTMIHKQKVVKITKDFLNHITSVT